jgi:LmbE family N-acetylglucosaminyl deacetylase
MYRLALQHVGPLRGADGGGDDAAGKAHASMTTQILSAHLDDAVFSAYAGIARNRDVTVTTVFAGVPASDTPLVPYDRLTKASSPRGRYEQRRREDTSAGLAGGWQVRHMDYLEKSYRDGEVDPTRIADRLLRDMTGEVRELWYPAGIGNQIDHLLTRRVAEIAVEAIGCRSVMYADLPYAADFGWPSWVTGGGSDDHLDPVARWTAVFDRSEHRPADAEIVQLSEPEQVDKMRFCRMYESQFAATEAGPSRGLSHPERLPYELTWRSDEPGAQS